MLPRMWVCPIASVTPVAAAAVPTMPTLPKLTPLGAMSPSAWTRMNVPGTICSAKFSSIARSFDPRWGVRSPRAGHCRCMSRAARHAVFDPVRSAVGLDVEDEIGDHALACAGCADEFEVDIEGERARIFDRHPVEALQATRDAFGARQAEQLGTDADEVSVCVGVVAAGDADGDTRLHTAPELPGVGTDMVADVATQPERADAARLDAHGPRHPARDSGWQQARDRAVGRGEHVLAQHVVHR